MSYSEKSHVSMEQRVCEVCGNVYDTNAILLDRRLRPSMERHTLTGWGLCPEHQDLYDQGYIALVECAPSQRIPRGDVLRQEEADRTGVVAHIKAEAWENAFSTPAPTDSAGERLPMVFVQSGVVEALMGMVEKPQEN